MQPARRVKLCRNIFSGTNVDSASEILQQWMFNVTPPVRAADNEAIR